MQLVDLQQITRLPLVEQWERLVSIFVGASVESDALDREVAILLETISQQVLRSNALTLTQKMDYFEGLNKLGDPRLSVPSDDAYWVETSVLETPLLVAKYPVTIKEWLHFLKTDYNNDQHWSESGLQWRNNRRITWEELAAVPDSQKYVFDNQPVVGVSWYEAEAYAKAHGARLMEFFEREEIVRGEEGRRYPWGRNFKHGYANTEETGLDKPSAVGFFWMDQTPEGIFDLAGNVAEWLGDDMDDERLMHPGCWANGTISTWVKASEQLSPKARLAYLGFRLVKDQ